MSGSALAVRDDPNGRPIFPIAQGHAKAAADPFVPPEGREAFANKAEWFDFLARRERRALHSDASACGHSDMNASPFSSLDELFRATRAINE